MKTTFPNGALACILAAWFCPLNLAVSGPRIQTQNAVVPFSFPYTIGQTVNTTLAVPAYPNPDGNLMGIKYEFVGTDSFSGGYNIPDVPTGGLLSSGQTVGTLDFRPQNGVLVSPTPDTWADYCPYAEGCPAGSYPESYSDPLALGPYEWNPALKGKVNPAGGSVPVSYTSTATPPGSWAGNGTYAGFVTITYSYDDKTAAEYALDILNNPYIKMLTDPAEQSREYYRLVINLRENISGVSYPGASVNERIRQLEYFGRGFSGAQVLLHGSVDGTDSFNDLANAGVYVSEPLYNELKRLGIIGAENSNPISASAQTRDAREGWSLGMQGMTLEQAIKQYFGIQTQTPPTNRPSPPPLMQPLALQSSATTVIPYRLAFIPTSAPNVLQVPAANQADYVVVVSDRGLTSFKVNGNRNIPAGFSVSFGSTTVAAVEGQTVSVPATTNTTQTFTLHSVAPVTNNLTLAFNFSQTGTAVVAISPTQAVDFNTFYGNVTITNIHLKILGQPSEMWLVANGPSSLQPHLQRSTNLLQWTTLTNFDSYNGDVGVRIFPATNRNEFFRLSN